MRLMAAVLKSTPLLREDHCVALSRFLPRAREDSGHVRGELKGCSPAATRYSQHDRLTRGGQPTRAISIIVAVLWKVFGARLVLAISPSWRNSPSGRSPVSQDAASAYEIALGVAFGSLLSDVVTRVT